MPAQTIKHAKAALVKALATFYPSEYCQIVHFFIFLDIFWISGLQIKSQGIPAPVTITEFVQLLCKIP